MLFLLLLLVSAKVETGLDCRIYNQTKSIYDYQIKNENITGEERSKLMNYCIDCNSEILSNRKHHKNIFIGCFYSKKIANFELLDFNKLPQPTKG